MTKIEKRLAKLKDKNKAITYDEVESLLITLGFDPDNKGKTSGSRIMFYRKSDGATIRVHKPHPGKELKTYQKDEIVRILKDKGDLK